MNSFRFRVSGFEYWCALISNIKMCQLETLNQKLETGLLRQRLQHFLADIEVGVNFLDVVVILQGIH